MSNLKPLTPLQRGWLALLELEQAYRSGEHGTTLLVSRGWFKNIIPLRWQTYHSEALHQLVDNGWLIKERKFYRLTEAARVNLANNYSHTQEFSWVVELEQAK